MKIVGMQKLSMVDYPDKASCVIFTKGCNYHCPFCHNSSLLDNSCKDVIPEKEIFEYLDKRKGIIEAIVVSGGEPTLQSDLKDFLRKLRQKDILIKLDTNGGNPKILKEIIEEKLVDYVAMDIKNSLEKYPLTTMISSLDVKNVLESISLLKENKIDYEFRTTIVKELHTIDDIESMTKLIGSSKYYLQNFKDCDGVEYEGLHGFSEIELKKFEEKFPGLIVRGLALR